MKLPSYIILNHCVIFIVKPSSCFSRNIGCPLEKKIVRVKMIDGKFVPVYHHHHDHDNVMSSQDKGNTRNLRKEDPFLRYSSRYRVLDSDDNNRNNTNYDNSEKNDTIYTAHECPCAISSTPAYCLRTAGNENRCEVNMNGVTQCFHSSASLRFVRSTWVMLVIGYFLAILYFISTERGRLTVRYVCSQLFCIGDGNSAGFLETILEEDLRRQRNRRDNVTYLLKTKKYFANSSNFNHPENEGGVGKGNLELSPIGNTCSSTGSSLTYSDEQDDVGANSSAISNGTKLRDDKSTGSKLQMTTTPACPPLIHSDRNVGTSTKDVVNTATFDDLCDESDHDGETCSICMLAIEDGDRIGALRCDHNFHVDCLKEWIKRRNVCPLCQCPDIADVRRPSTDPEASTYEGLITTLTSVDGESSLQNSDPRSSVTRMSRPTEANRGVARTILFPTNQIRGYFSVS